MCLACSSERAPVGSAEILWDKWGVPHIFAADDAAAFYAFGWAQMHAHGNVIPPAPMALACAPQSIGARANLTSDRWVGPSAFPNVHASVSGSKRGLSRATRCICCGHERLRHRQSASDLRRVESRFSGYLCDVLAHTRESSTSISFHIPRCSTRYKSRHQGGAARIHGHFHFALCQRHTMLLQNPHLWWKGFYLFTEAQLHTPAPMSTVPPSSDSRFLSLPSMTGLDGPIRCIRMTARIYTAAPTA